MIPEGHTAVEQRGAESWLDMGSPSENTASDTRDWCPAPHRFLLFLEPWYQTPSYLLETPLSAPTLDFGLSYNFPGVPQSIRNEAAEIRISTLARARGLGNKENLLLGWVSQPPRHLQLVLELRTFQIKHNENTPEEVAAKTAIDRSLPMCQAIFAECFIGINVLDPQDNPMSYSHFTAGETEAGRSCVTCPRLSS